MKIQLKPANKITSSIVAEGRFEAEKDKKFKGGNGDTLLVPSGNGKGPHTLLIGLGKKENYTLEKVRIAAARVISQAKSLKLESAALDLDSFIHKFAEEEVAAAAVEGARLSLYRFDKYKSKPAPVSSFAAFDLHSTKAGRSSRMAQAIADAEVISEAVKFTRDVANEPPNVLSPARFAEAAKQMAAKNNLSCKVLGLSEIKKLKMGGVLGVCQGSANEPRFVVLENRVKSSGRPIVLVGKGVTFDSGGISIKPAGNMDHMKFDMCGAAAVMGAMKAISNLKIPVKVIGITPLVENMPGGRAQRPGDIITCLNGKTVEVLNTDAEGRLILADALAYAERFKPRALVDIATLTGACAAMLGDKASGLMSTDADVASRLKEAGEMSGERLWEFPMWEEYFDLIKATYADIQNISKKNAGVITAALFLKEFADHTTAWAHLDIAGTAWNEGGPRPLSPIGATGMGVRLFVRFVKSYAGR